MGTMASEEPKKRGETIDNAFDRLCDVIADNKQLVRELQGVLEAEKPSPKAESIIEESRPPTITHTLAFAADMIIFNNKQLGELVSRLRDVVGKVKVLD